MDIIKLLNELQAIARMGLHYTSDPYDKVRYERLMTLATQQYEAFIQMPASQLIEHFQQEVGSITPKIGADAAIFNDKGEILLMERSDGTGWCLPCGWVEVYERPIDTVVREVREETGLEVAVTQLVGIFTRPASAEYGLYSMVAMVHLCEVVGGTLTLSHEGTALRYWDIDVVTHWHAIHEKYARAAYERWQSLDLLPAISD